MHERNGDFYVGSVVALDRDGKSSSVCTATGSKSWNNGTRRWSSASSHSPEPQPSQLNGTQFKENLRWADLAFSRPASSCGFLPQRPQALTVKNIRKNIHSGFSDVF